LAVIDATGEFGGGAPNAIYVLPGKGDGTFGTPISSGDFGNIMPAIPLAVADFNGDGKPDLAMGGYVFLGNGDGTFRMGATLSENTQSTVGDFNGDGKPDIAQVGFEGVSISTGNGDGTFNAPTVSFLAGTGAIYAAVGDFNGDGKPDVATANTISGNVTVLTNTTNITP
jgi:hypothetical protein